MQLYVKANEGVQLPHKVNKEDAGYDIFAFSDGLVKGVDNTGETVKDVPADNWSLWKRIDYIEYRTGLYWAQHRPVDKTDWNRYLECQKHIELFPRSSISKDTNMVVCNSIPTIDHPYRGEVLVRFKYIWQPEDLEVGAIGILGRINFDKIYKKGFPIIQMKARIDEDIDFHTMTPEKWDELKGTERGEGNFGSTNEKRGV